MLSHIFNLSWNYLLVIDENELKGFLIVNSNIRQKCLMCVVSLAGTIRQATKGVGSMSSQIAKINLMLSRKIILCWFALSACPYKEGHWPACSRPSMFSCNNVHITLSCRPNDTAINHRLCRTLFCLSIRNVMKRRKLFTIDQRLLRTFIDDVDPTPNLCVEPAKRNMSQWEKEIGVEVIVRAECI